MVEVDGEAYAWVDVVVPQQLCSFKVALTIVKRHYFLQAFWDLIMDYILAIYDFPHDFQTSFV